MQLYFRPFFQTKFSDNKIILKGQQNTKNEFKKKTHLTEQISNPIPDADQPFCAMCDASNFGIGAAL